MNFCTKPRWVSKKDKKGQGKWYNINKDWNKGWNNKYNNKDWNKGGYKDHNNNTQHQGKNNQEQNWYNTYDTAPAAHPSGDQNKFSIPNPRAIGAPGKNGKGDHNQPGSVTSKGEKDAGVGTKTRQALGVR